MNIFTRFNRKNIQDRQIDTLIGLSKGITADGKVNQQEAEFLYSWLVQNQSYSDNPIIQNLFERLNVMLSDGILDDNEASELMGALQSISGEKSEIGEIAKTSSLPVNDPLPPIQFSGASFLFTGTCAYGSRKDCKAITEKLGGTNAASVTKSLDYLILGTYVTDSWAHETFGRKIEKAMLYRDEGLPIVIVTEEHWANEAGL